MPVEPETDLHWTAFLYVSGELTEADASRFESRLADDQAARDAVAGAVELAGALAIVGPDQSRRRPRPMLRRALVGASLLAAAACVVLAVSPWGRPAPADRPGASEVAVAWSSLRTLAEADVGPAAIGPAEVAPVSEAGFADEPEADRALPSWLLSATSAVE